MRFISRVSSQSQIDALKGHFTRSTALRTVRMYVPYRKELFISGWLGDLDFCTRATQPAWMTLKIYLPLFSDDVTLYSLQNVDMFSGVRNLEAMSSPRIWPWQDLLRRHATTIQAPSRADRTPPSGIVQCGLTGTGGLHPVDHSFASSCSPMCLSSTTGPRLTLLTSS
ncbi:hypothetical protein BD311DRAFT_338694 [Dichomitus squalens]|uniref:Uncharacterized protein n=1 Tax=Dichomitus squalens TaxID=114155 RepID=A0A4Q9N0L9_9APHY|nr:hypothetical protein BD311DRAFT_338694 [Dichomitus squalens]